jgi:hypothetical protein
MKLLTLEEWMSLFKRNMPGYEDFLAKARVRASGGRLVKLLEYADDNKIPRRDLKLLYENIVERADYLGRFYNRSLLVDTGRFSMDSEAPMGATAMNNDRQVMYKNVIRNMHYRDILRETRSGIPNVPTFLEVLENLYKKFIIDYKILTPSARFYMKEGRLGSVFSSFYFRASIMNPYLVYSLNRSVLRGTRVFTPTLGWSSYCYGFLECPDVVEYVGTDVIVDVCNKTRQFSEKMENWKGKRVEIHCKPSEVLARSKPFLKKYSQHFDVVFFSPPYYRYELYPGENQSTETYSTYEEWLAGYWEPTIRLCHRVLQPGGRMCYILSDYGGDAEKFALVKDMNEIAKRYFTLKRVLPMHNKNVNSTAHRETAEKIMVFVK